MLNFSMITLNFLFSFIDLFAKVHFRVKNSLSGKTIFSKSSKSDSDSTSYGAYVNRAVTDPRHFKRFRRGYSYRAILEHVDYFLGKEYLERLTSETVSVFVANPCSEKLSQIGKPRKYYYKNLGWISPTILRYLFVNQHLVRLFGKSEIKSIAEIGIGFGGQIAVILESFDLNSYTMYDLPQVAKLGEKFLGEANADLTKIKSEDIENLTPKIYDLVLSNYAFSELPQVVQLEYTKSIFAISKRGYLTMNSGRTNLSGRSTGKMSIEELKLLIPGCEILEESPLSGPDNYILVWGHKPLS
jgi:hypothetical protein